MAKQSIGRLMSENYELYDVYTNIANTSSLAKLRKMNYSQFTIKKLKLKLLGANLIKEISKKQDILSFVLRSHLYLEHLLNEIINNKFRNPDFFLKSKFHQKLELLYAKNYLDHKLYNDIGLINSLRNKFAHNLTYSIADFDMSKFSYYEDYNNDIKKRTKIWNQEVNLFFLKHKLFDVLIKLTQRYSFVSAIKMPK